ncbi:solute:Na+ symporter, SSS family [Chitinophaga terrae (ex Kim and Jung 2007)]|uniref:Solute:Na+ symporter, SSS family n=1 Tax=Chitinophaga terrae (ex Kim and Jung 2007) TaxID=408074 RepID=A0A1H4C4A6_9BACT|nr:sodium/sugar symporter [Chitinophaga terrae (ex Kim and Jung 2007)]MDQ0108501.1 SSS family solute:Na+ symporter [Chitinophaga terrae (ex Kim and Jung 2007)]GEP92209.1 transporter [Chitinophaga terrae (ex Kim and Jung 2007)]SEA55133.1 solute:Na+ symporter, SSS family [Chitinophaga terrae (ex Kim and Jung 2007)]
MQTKSLHIFDYLVFLVYFVIVAGYGYYIYHKKKKATTDSKDFFLAEGSLTWWAIGASLIASNISAEQFIGMSGSGFNIGLAISTYEWMAAATLIVVAVFFLPIYLKNKIYTMPQFLERRYNQTVSTIMAVFWLLLYIVVNLTSILYLGALAVSTISGINFFVCMGALAFFAILITLGGMKVIGYTDVIQVFFLILGGLATTYLALQLVSSHFGTNGVLKGFSLLTQHASDHFHMILYKENPKYLDLPGLSVLIGGMWIVNLNYWGCNQYITQRALGADLKTARNGLLFAGFLKLLMPIIVVLPGIAAYVLYTQNHGDFGTAMTQGGSLNPDNAYPVLLNLLPAGLKGLAFAALTAAVVASLAGKANSISTIFTLDIYKKIYNKEADEKKIVSIGRTTVVITMIIAMVISNFLGIDKKGGFQFIQEYTGFVSPGVFAMFALGFFWKRTTSNAALFAMIGGLLMSFILKFLPGWVNLEPLYQIGFSALNPDSGLYEIPFIDRMGFVFIICVLGMVIISVADKKSINNPKGLAIDAGMFKPNVGFTVGATLIVGILIALYTVFW